MMFIENDDPPPPLPLTDDDQLKLKIEALAGDDRWVKNMIDGLAGTLRDVSTEACARSNGGGPEPYARRYSHHFFSRVCTSADRQYSEARHRCAASRIIQGCSARLRPR